MTQDEWNYCSTVLYIAIDPNDCPSCEGTGEREADCRDDSILVPCDHGVAAFKDWAARTWGGNNKKTASADQAQTAKEFPIQRAQPDCNTGEVA